jgi:hypothetical protein
MFHRLSIASTKVCKVAPCFAQRQVVWPRILVELIDVEAIIFPKANGTNVILAAIVESEVIAAGALIQH